MNGARTNGGREAFPPLNGRGSSPATFLQVAVAILALECPTWSLADTGSLSSSPVLRALPSGTNSFTQPLEFIDAGAITFSVTGWGAVASTDSIGAGFLLNQNQVINTPLMLSREDALKIGSPGGQTPGGDNLPARGPVTTDDTTAYTVGVACGEFHTVLLKRDGSLLARGWNIAGQLDVPMGLDNVIAVACGADHSLALRRDGAVLAWGDNRFAQSTVPTDLKPAIAVAGGSGHSLALLTTGHVIGWGANFFSQATPPESLDHVKAIAAGANHSLALRTDGTVHAWGENLAGQCDVPPKLQDVVQIAGGGRFSLALQRNGTVVGWGANEFGQSTPPADLKGVVSIAAGDYHALALKADGSVVAWGDNSFASAEVPPGLSNVVAIAAGGFHSEVLVQAIPVLTHFRRSTTHLTTDLNLPAGTLFQIEASTDLAAWTTLRDGIAIPGEMQVQEPIDESRAQLFLKISPIDGAVRFSAW